MKARDFGRRGGLQAVLRLYLMNIHEAGRSTRAIDAAGKRSTFWALPSWISKCQSGRPARGAVSASNVTLHSPALLQTGRAVSLSQQPQPGLGKENSIQNPVCDVLITSGWW
ncbi:hypothetical protein RRG08_058926 [Elysia crispata]|uniref:Uncharacterized protein n=1 Tax=Elysia crispata TaxID=231223 RepID=A0AAE0XRH1_9GAST|nr:hypothetical protein RRG08_058926 [Elysia crispata]